MNTLAKNSTLSSVIDYMPQLDGLRALAVLSVAYCHWLPAQQFGLPWGSAGVQMFFILSGFLITKTLLSLHTESMRTRTIAVFYARRALRILPAYYAVLLLAYAVNVPPVRETFLWHAAHVSNFYFYAHGSWDGPMSHLWSLAVQEQFYLVWPIVAVFVPRHLLKSCVISLIATAAAARVILTAFAPQEVFWGVLPQPNLDTLCLGALLAFPMTEKQSRAMMKAAKVACVAFIALFAVRTSGIDLPLQYAWEHFTTGLALAGLILGASKGLRGATGALLLSRPLRRLGKRSYSFYLIHVMSYVPIVYLSPYFPGVNLFSGPTEIILRLAFTLLWTELSWIILERPLLRLKRYVSYSKSNAENALLSRQPLPA